MSLRADGPPDRTGRASRAGGQGCALLLAMPVWGSSPAMTPLWEAVQIHHLIILNVTKKEKIHIRHRIIDMVLVNIISVVMVMKRERVLSQRCSVPRLMVSVSVTSR